MTLLKSESLDARLDQVSSLFQLLSDKTRFGILLLLSGGERNVGKLCEEMGLAQPTVSHHLGLLRNRNLIVGRRHGKQVYYSLVRPPNRDGREGVARMEFFLDQFIVAVTPASSQTQV